MINLQNSKKLHELGVECLSNQYYWDKPKKVGKIENVVEGICCEYNLDSILTKEALVKWVKDAELLHKETKNGYTFVGIRQNWQYHRNKLAEIYSEQGYEGVNKYLETYLTRDINK